MAARRQRPLITGEVLPAGVQAAVLSRAGGNPLYAQEFARLVLERGPTADSDEVPVPDSLQGLIAPRLDALPREEKEVLQDAAVVERCSGVARSSARTARATMSKKR
jgi:predicted ATPase